MQTAQPLPRSWKTRVTAMLIVGLLSIMFLTNPTRNGFRRYLKEYVNTESGATLAPGAVTQPGDFRRADYYLYSLYTVSIEGVDHHFIGMFGSFHNFY